MGAKVDRTYPHTPENPYSHTSPEAWVKKALAEGLQLHAEGRSRRFPLRAGRAAGEGQAAWWRPGARSSPDALD